ncbi:MAG: hydantoinase/oxoprolinase family protein, partial [Desulfobacterales bacterium]
ILMPPYGLFDPGDIDYEPKSIVSGRLEITGKEIDPVNELQVRLIAREMVKRFQVKAFAVSGFAGTINPEHELLVQRLLHEETGLFVTCGHELSDLLNFRTRAMTAVLNARIIPRSIDLLDNIEGVLLKHGIKALIVVVKGDGTLMSAEMARERPVETILSGPAASVAGAHYLTDCEDAIVVDVGGTTSDIAAFQKGEVKICKNGADIGGFKTHVKALEIRTAGLGGDSFISWEKDHFEISPQRVGPIAWLGAKDPGTHKALRYMMYHPGSYQSSTKTMQILIKTGAVDNMSLTNQEKEIVKLLEKRPYSLDELAKYVETPHRMLLHLTHLEDNFIIQRCGLTPTDLLHVTEKFDRWDKKASLKICKLVSQITGLEVKELAEKILEQFIKKLAKEILEKELVEKTGHPGLKESKSCQVIIDHILSGADKDHVLQAKLSKPIIAIGAPVQNFLPGAAKLLNARLIIPKNEDVANAVGAITSKIMIRRKVTIKPDQEGGFLIEGLEGNRQFLKFERAVEHAENELVCLVRKIGRASGTSEKSIEINVEDKIPATANGSPVFLGRTLTAQLKGKPDMLPKQKSLGQSALA